MRRRVFKERICELFFWINHKEIAGFSAEPVWVDAAIGSAVTDVVKSETSKGKDTGSTGKVSVDNKDGAEKSTASWGGMSTSVGVLSGNHGKSSRFRPVRVDRTPAEEELCGRATFGVRAAEWLTDVLGSDTRPLSETIPKWSRNQQNPFH